jgi:glycine hydroxymethyltransferase
MHLADMVYKHEGWRRKCINLIASENVTSTAVRTMLTSDLGHRYSLHGISMNNFYMGTKYIEHMLEYSSAIARKLFDARYADLKLTSGHACALAALMYLTKNYDPIMSLRLENGGYPGYTQGYMPKRLGLRVHEIPFDDERMRIDVAECVERICSIKPKPVVIGQSMITFATSLRRIANACQEVDSKLIYDGSHILGLIAGRAFPNALCEGAGMLLGSTHKSFPGPQGGIILSDDEYPISGYIPLRVDNPHFNRIAALILAMEEMLRFGRQYAKQIVSNARALAKALDDNGVEVVGKKHGYTETHQVLLEPDEPIRLAKALEKANIITDVATRLGTCEITRLGMKEGEMRYIAELIALVHNSIGKRHFGTRILRVRKEVEEIMLEYGRYVTLLILQINLRPCRPCLWPS